MKFFNKKQYIIINRTKENTLLYYNGIVSPVFITRKELAQKFPDKKTALEKLEYACKNATGLKAGTMEILKVK